MSAPVPTGPTHAFDDTLGTMLIGVLFATFLQGMLTLQLYYYYDTYNKDSLGLKILVGAVWCLDTLHLILISHGLYWYTVSNWGNFDALPVSTWQLDSHVAVTGLTSFLCQAYFLKRLWVLSSRNWFLVLWPFLGALGSCVLDIAITAQIIKTPLFSEFPKTQSEAVGTFTLTAVTDATLALLLCYFLARQKTAFKQTQTIIRKVIQYTITTGLFTSVIAIISLICFVVKPNSFMFFSTYFSLGSLYTNSFLANLNTRQHLRAVHTEDTMMNPSLSLPQFHGRSKIQTDPVRIMVSTTTCGDDDHLHSDK